MASKIGRLCRVVLEPIEDETTESEAREPIEDAEDREPERRGDEPDDREAL